MEFELPIHLSAEFVSFLALLLFLYCLFRQITKTDSKAKPPQPSGSWPVIGHLHLLGELPHITLGNLAEKYGPVFMIKLGVKRALVVSTAEMAEECLRGTNNKVFLNRPQKMYVEHLAYNGAMLGFSQYGEYWFEIRKKTTDELLSPIRVKMFKDVRISESLKEFYQGEEYNRCAKAIRDFFELVGVFVPADALPFLRWFDIGGYEKKMKKVAKEIDQIAQRWLDEHKNRSSEEAQEKLDFIDVMLESGQIKTSKYETDTIIKATCMAMILAAADTTAVTLTWKLSLLLKNNEILKKTQAELDMVVGKERKVEESDLKKVYLEAVLKETMRLYPAGPLSVPRESIKDCTVSGYDIPSGTQLFVNLYKIHRDPQVWADPLEFSPERFLTANDVIGQNYGFMPFGSGMRICPGISFALPVMLFTLANLLHGFDISIPSDETIDMTESFGLTNMKTTPLEVIISHRLPSNLYDNFTMVVN